MRKQKKFLGQGNVNGNLKRAAKKKGLKEKRRRVNKKLRMKVKVLHKKKLFTLL